MKKLRWTAIFCLTALILSISAGAAGIGTVVDYALHTDIVAEIGGAPLRSFNIGNRTAVVAEDLRRYGFDVFWNEQERTLQVERNLVGVIAPNYTPPENTNPIGSRAASILSTDIVTYVAGKPVESFNIGGETAIWFTDLAVFGQVQWKAEERLASLALGNAQQMALDALVKNLAESGLRYDYEIVEGETAKAFLGHQYGTPHGVATQLVLVKNNGTQYSIHTQFPQYGFGTYYLDIQELAFTSGVAGALGEVFTFRTPVKKEIDGQGVDLGVRLCSVDVRQGLLTIHDANFEGESWSAYFSPEGQAAMPLDTKFRATIRREGLIAPFTLREGNTGAANVSVSSEGMRIAFYVNLLPDGANYEFGPFYRALFDLDLPRVTQTDNFTNTQQQRQQVAQYIEILRPDGTRVEGNAWWSQGNNHVDLNFDFDDPLWLNEGEEIQVRVGLPN